MSTGFLRCNVCAAGAPYPRLPPLLAHCRPSRCYPRCPSRPWFLGALSTSDGYGLAVQVVAYDFGIKHNILRRLTSAGCKVTVVPAAWPAQKVLDMNPDGIFLSNGPVRDRRRAVLMCLMSAHRNWHWARLAQRSRACLQLPSHS
jgi:Glutamine amidotransferase class-I